MQRSEMQIQLLYIQTFEYNVIFVSKNPGVFLSYVYVRGNKFAYSTIFTAQ